MDMDKFLAYIRFHNITGKSLAETLGISESTWWRKAASKNGEQISIDEFSKICTTYGFTRDEINDIFLPLYSQN